MEIMYIKYTQGIRHSIIKEDGNTIINYSKILPFKPVKKVEINEYTPNLNTKKSTIDSTFTDETNKEITAFFFDAIHKNYLLSRNKYR
jgi:hypothetical protein